MMQHNRPQTINAIPPATPTPTLNRLIVQYRRLKPGHGTPAALRQYADAIDRAIDAELVNRAQLSFTTRVTESPEAT